MANGAQHGIAVGCAAALMKEHGITPREIAGHWMDDLREAVEAMGGAEA